MPQSVVELLAYCQDKLGCHQNGHIWLIVPHCLIWCLWRERNNRCFENNERYIPDLKLFFFRISLNWLVALQNQSFTYFLDFLDSCNFCTWLLTHIHSLCSRVSLFYINKTYYLSKKKKKKSPISIYLHANCLTQGLPSLIYRTNDIVSTLLSKSNLLLGTIWLFFNIPSETNQGHNHSTIVMVNLPAKLVYLILSVLCNTTKTKCHVKEEVLIKNIMLIFLLR